MDAFIKKKFYSIGAKKTNCVLYPCGFKQKFRTKALRAFISTNISLNTREIMGKHVERWSIEIFFRQSKNQMTFERYQIRSSKGLGCSCRWLTLSAGRVVGKCFHLRVDTLIS